MWKQFNEDYDISTEGQVRYRKNGNLVSLYLHDKDNGYLAFKAGSKNIKVHQAVLKVFVGEKPEGYTVDHKNFDTFDNRLENLEYVPKDTNLPRRRTGRANRILTEQERGEIIFLWFMGLNKSQIAEVIGVKQRTARTYVNRYVGKANLPQDMAERGTLDHHLRHSDKVLYSATASEDVVRAAEYLVDKYCYIRAKEFLDNRKIGLESVKEK